MSPPRMRGGWCRWRNTRRLLRTRGVYNGGACSPLCMSPTDTDTDPEPADGNGTVTYDGDVLPVDWKEAATVALEADRDPESHRELDPRRFHPSQVGYCDRQCYVKKLGIGGPGPLGKFHVGTMIHEWLEHDVAPFVRNGAAEASMKAEHPVETTVDGITFTGTADAYFPEMGESGVVVDYKSRGGWYNFDADDPPERHLTQLHVYMHALGAQQAQIVYINKKDTLDIRQFPPGASGQTFRFNPELFEAALDRAKRVRDAILDHGFPSHPADIPFDKCGCYMCGEETLSFPNDMRNGGGD